MIYKLETLIKLLSILAPVVFFMLPSGAIDSGNPIAFLLFSFPYFVVFALTQFVKHKNKGFLFAIAILLALLIISSIIMLSGTGSDPQSTIGVSIIFVAQSLLAALYVSIYFVVRALTGNAHNKPRQRDTNT